MTDDKRFAKEQAERIIDSADAQYFRWLLKHHSGSMDGQQRVVLYSAMLKAPVGCMRQSIGTEATLAILDAAKEYLTNG